MNKFVIHPFLFSLFPVFFLYSHNKGQVLLSDTLLPILFIMVITLLALTLSWLYLRNIKKAGIIVSLFLVLFFSYGHVLEALSGLNFGDFFLGRNRYIMSLSSIILITGLIITRRTKSDLIITTHLMNLVSAILLIFSVINIGIHELNAMPSRHNFKTNKTDIKINATKFKNQEQLRDIYYIILDKYANANTLKEIYNFDNSKFINFLRQKNFYIATESCSNYQVTPFSLASSLNMNYINYLSEVMGKNSRDYYPFYILLQDYPVWRFLKSKGYKFIHLGSWWKPTMKNKFADININYHPMHEYYYHLYKTTMFYHIDKQFNITRYSNWRLLQWERVLYKFKQISEIPKLREPTFLFAHMLVPHDPYVFDRNGKFITSHNTIKSKNIENENKEIQNRYIDQLVFVNKLVIELVQKLLSTSDTPPIIIIQADEGPMPIRLYFNPDSFNWLHQVTETELMEKVKILNALYLPDFDYHNLYPSITPVNTFRIIFNFYFNTDLDILPDDIYIFEDYNHPYDYYKMTDKVMK